MLGTPEYMAPEQCRGKAVDARTDIYALGVMLYELVTGRRPFTHASPLRVLAMQLSSHPIRPSNFASISQALEWVVMTCLAKDIDERISSCAELIQHLRRVIPERLPWKATLEAPGRTRPPSGEAPSTRINPPIPLKRDPGARVIPITMVLTDEVVLKTDTDDDLSSEVARLPEQRSATITMPPEPGGLPKTGMLDVLQALRGSVPDVIGAAVISMEGEMIAEITPEGADGELIASMTAAIRGVSGSISWELLDAKMDQIFVKTEAGTLIIQDLDEDSVLALHVTTEAKLGLIFTSSRRSSSTC